MKALSYGQMGMWVLHQMDPSSPAYNLGIAFRCSDQPDVARLEKAVGDLVARHEILRSKVVETSDGPRAVAEDAFAQKVEVLPPSSDAEAVAAEFISRAFDLTTVPGIRVALIETDPSVLVICVHHIWADDASIRILAEELSQLYGQPGSLENEPQDVSSFVDAERLRLRGEELDVELAFWRRTLHGATDLAVPVHDFPDRHGAFGMAGRVELELPAEVVSKARQVAEDSGSTTFDVLAASYAAVAGEYAEVDQVVLGLVVEGRDDSRTERLAGMLVNTVPLRCPLPDESEFEGLIRVISERRVQALEHSVVPFEKLIEELRPGRRADANPFFNVLVSVDERRPLRLEFSDIVLAEIDLPPIAARLDLEVTWFIDPAAPRIRIDYNAGVYAHESIQAFGRRILKFLEWATLNPRAPFRGKIFGLTGETPQFTRSPVADGSAVPIHELIERRVRLQPDSEAIVSSDGVITYGELWQMSEDVASSLLAMGRAQETQVALWAQRDAATIATMIGVLRAGATFVPIDPDLPEARRDLILSQLDDPVLVGEWGDAQGRRMASAESSANPVPVNPNQSAYVIFTSGTTGTPKGAVIPHRALSLFSQEVASVFELTEADRVLQFASLSFDASIEEIFPTLIAGATVVLRARELWGPEELMERSNALGLTVLDLPTAYWHELVRAQRDSAQKIVGDQVRLVIIGGEAASPDAVCDWLESPGKDVTLLNTYGPTETTVTATCQRIDRAFKRVPIGKPLNGVSARVLDKRLNEVPEGVVGDLYIGGIGVGRGYVSLPGQTADRFIPDPFAGDGSRLYRSGDRCRYDFEGKLEFFGRGDDQVKLRGFRIELADIAAALLAHPRVEDVAALMVERDSTAMLCAWVVPETAPGEAELKTFLRDRLPEYMIPSAISRMPALPKTAGRKLDRKALPLPDLKKPASTVPRTPTEDLVATVWQSVLGGEAPSPSDDFFALGGHSLLATQVMSRLRKDFSVDLPLRTIFEHPTVSELAAALETAIHEGVFEEEVPLRRQPGVGPFRLSLEQERIWFFEQFEPGRGDYVIPMSVRLKGSIDPENLSQAIHDLSQANPAFRTYFSPQAGVPMQILDQDVRVTVETIDARGLASQEAADLLDRMRTMEASTPFDLSAAPLLRAKLIKLADDEAQLLLSMHHIVSDGWSVGIVADQLNSFYRARLEGRAPAWADSGVRYVDFAAWQREWVGTQHASAQLEYWKSHLSGGPASDELPTDRARPRVKTFNGARHSVRIPADLTARLSERARMNNATLFMVLLGAFKVLIHRYTGENSVRVGTPIAGRNRRELESIVGFFVNTLIMQTEIPDEADFDSVVAAVRQSAIGAYAHQDLPFEKVVSELQPERDPSRSPLTQLMFVMHNTPKPVIELPGCEPAVIEAPTNAFPVDLTLEVDEVSGELEVTVLYNTDLFDAGTIERFATHYSRVLEAVAPGVDSIARIDFMAPEERALITKEWNQTATAYPRDSTVHGLFEEVAKASPAAVAVEWDGEQLTYSELNERAEALAGALMTKSMQGAPVAILLDRSPGLIVAMLAVMKTGAPYVPLDPEYPTQRLAFMLNDAEARAVVTDARHLHRVRELGDVEVVNIDASIEKGEIGSAPSVTAMSAAYVMYTSGSTGTPKGIMIPHRGIVRLVRKTNYVDLRPEDIVAQASNASFDAATFEIWGALLNGARLCGLSKEILLSPKSLRRELSERGITTMVLTTALFNQIVSEEPLCFESVGSVLFGGEVGDPKKAAALMKAGPPRRLVNVYGPTESTTFATTYEVPKQFDEEDPLPIGRPVSNTTVYVLDRHMNPVPVGVSGEIHIGGDGLAIEYMNRPALTKEKFIESEFGRIYRTGDLGKFNSRGEIEFLGRIDEQLKIRGFRVEPAEIENAIQTHSGVAQAVVIARRRREQLDLVAYFVPSHGSGPDLPTLKSHLAGLLPQYMVPRYFVPLESIPLTPNGKVDKARLPEPEGLAAAQQYVAPSTEIERELAGIWEEILELPEVGTDQSFFELGGHSLIATQMVARITDRLGVELPLKVVFEEATIQQLAVVVEAAMAMGKKKRAPIPRLARRPGK